MTNENSAAQAQRDRYHILKTDPEVFQAVLSGAKTFEIRLNDRGYAVGDVLGLRETKHTGAEMRAGAPLVYTGRECQRFVSHVLTGYGLADGWCCLSFRLPHAAGESAPVAGEAKPSDADITNTIRALDDQARYTRDVDGEMGVRVKDVMIARAVLARYGHTPLPMADAAPQASAEYDRGHADGWAAGWDQAIKQPQADKDGCTCPSGDGSLRHPCPAHPQTNEGRA